MSDLRNLSNKLPTPTVFESLPEVAINYPPSTIPNHEFSYIVCANQVSLIGTIETWFAITCAIVHRFTSKQTFYIQFIYGSENSITGRGGRVKENERDEKTGEGKYATRRNLELEKIE